jgi:hypothetical protein
VQGNTRREIARWTGANPKDVKVVPADTRDRWVTPATRSRIVTLVPTCRPLICPLDSLTCLAEQGVKGGDIDKSLLRICNPPEDLGDFVQKILFLKKVMKSMRKLLLRSSIEFDDSSSISDYFRTRLTFEEISANFSSDVSFVPWDWTEFWINTNQWYLRYYHYSRSRNDGREPRLYILSGDRRIGREVHPEEQHSVINHFVEGFISLMKNTPHKGLLEKMQILLAKSEDQNDIMKFEKQVELRFNSVGMPE